MATSPEQLDLPLSIEPVEGWRGWRLARHDGALTLLSLTRSSAWPPREAMRSTCAEHPDGPAMRCRCGLYASSSPRTLARARVLSCGPAVVGDVAMWGRVVDHTAGTRSQFAYPQRMRLVCGPCVSAGRGGVAPVAVVDLHEELVPVCRRHRSEMAGEARPAAEVERELLATYAVDLLPGEPVSGPLRSPVMRRRSPVRMVGKGVLYAGLYLVYAYVSLWLLIAAVMAVGVVAQAVTSSPAAVQATPAATHQPTVGDRGAPTVRVAPIPQELRWRGHPERGRVRHGPFPAHRT